MRKGILALLALLTTFLLSLALPYQGALAATRPVRPSPTPDEFPKTLKADFLLPPKSHVAIWYDAEAGSLQMTPLPEPPLPAIAYEAVNRAPSWLRWKVLKTFVDMMLVELDDRTTGARLAKPALADLNGDGLLDLFVGVSTGRVLYFENIGTRERPIFLDKSDLLEDIEISGTHVAPAVGDLNGDGLVDLAVGREDGRMDFWWNVGTPEEPRWIKASEVFSTVNVGRCAMPYFVDLDEDGDLDLAVGTRGGTLYFYWNEGTPENPTWVQGDVLDGILVGQYAMPALAKLSSDGSWWLVVGTDDGLVHVFKNIETPEEPRWIDMPEVADLNVTGRCYVAIGDLNGDGLLDLVLGNHFGDVFVAWNEGTPEQPLFISRKSDIEETFINAGELHIPYIFIKDPVFFWRWYIDVFYSLHYVGTGRVWPGYYTDLDKVLITREHYGDYVAFIAEFLYNVTVQHPECADEIAYWIANEQPRTLRVIAYYALYEDNNILGDYLLNALSIYETADLLPYVRIVEHPEAEYTTVAYRCSNGSWVEVDPTIYYQYLSMPTKNTLSPYHRLSDNYEGRFFRTTLLYDNRYDVCLYELVRNASTPYEAAQRIHHWSWYIIRARWDNRGSWRASGWWQIWCNLNDNRDDSVIVMCGEFATITECWLKAALIPAVEALNEGEDHVWDEFYDPEHGWVHMDTTGPPESYFDNPRLYEEGWRKDVSAVFWSDHAGRYDHSVLSPLPYTYKAKIVFRVLDAHGRPLDGARVEAWSHWLIPRYHFAFRSFYNYTDENGEATLYLGHNNYTFVVISRLGYAIIGWPYPDAFTVEEDQTYTLEVRMSRFRPAGPSLLAEEGLPEELSQYHLSFSVELLGAYQYAPDSYGLYQWAMYEDVWDFKPGLSASISVYVLDGHNYAEFIKHHDFRAYMASERSTGLGLSDWPLSPEVLSDLYIVISNAHSETTWKHVRVSVTITYDTEPPTLIVEEPENGSIIDGNNITVVFSSPSPDIHHFEISVDGGPWVEATSPYTITGLEKGWHTIRIRAVDKSGLTSEVSITVLLDGEWLRQREWEATLRNITIYGGIGAACVAAAVAGFLILRRRARS